MAESPPVRIFLRPMGSPLTIGLSGLAIASLVQSGYDLGWVAKSEATQVGVVLVTVPFLLQLIAAVFSYLVRDAAAGACTGILSTTWLAMGLLHLVSPGQTSHAQGLLLVSAGGVLILAAIATSIGQTLPAFVFGLAAARFVLAGIYELSSSSTWQDVAGVVGIVVCGLAALTVLTYGLQSQRVGSVTEEPGAESGH